MNILLIEDEQNVVAFIRKGLEEEGYTVLFAYDGPAGLDLIVREHIDLVILDIVLPTISGLEVCKTIRKLGFREVPVLMLTALGTTDQVVKGLDSGADDYLVKPFKFKELAARIRTLLRRKLLSDEPGDFLIFADLMLDRKTRTAKRAGIEINLTSTEFRLLEYFMKNPRKVLTRPELLDNVWGIHFDMGTNVVDVFLSYLRNKIEKGFDTRLIHTVIGMGYILKEDEDRE